jgi:hypothetical protein
MSQLFDDTVSEAVYAEHVRPGLFGVVSRCSAERS